MLNVVRHNSEGLNGGGGVHMSVVGCQLKIFGKSLLIFLSLVGYFLPVLSAVSNIFCPLSVVA